MYGKKNAGKARVNGKLYICVTVLLQVSRDCYDNWRGQSRE